LESISIKQYPNSPKKPLLGTLEEAILKPCRSKMNTLVAGSLVLSVLHALIPSHWLPVLAIAKKESWSLNRTTAITFIAGLSHALSTVMVGIIVGVVGLTLADKVNYFTHLIAPSVLIALGLFYIHQHHKHKHFHLHQHDEIVSRKKVIASLVVAMFFSPCLEIEANFLMAGSQGWWMIALLAILYTAVTVGGMVLWVRFTYAGLRKLNWHTLEHNAGIITGITLVLTGIASFFFD
jgi:nickel/cobalt transporter (NicO) family protein